jgi:hypothetical protein
MSVHASDPSAVRDDGGPSAQRPARVLVLFESTPAGVAALLEAARLRDADAHLTVVTLAPQSVQPRCCARGPSVEVVNCVVREEAATDLHEAREILGNAADVAFETLVGTRDPPLHAWAAEQTFDVIVLPVRRLSLGGHPLARRLRRATVAEIRLIG